MRYLNLGCGSRYVISESWTNLDFISSSEHVIAHNLLKGIPFPDSSFDLVYHSHVLEHFSKTDGELLIKECFRVLKPQGILRIAIPDLEQIATNYLKYLKLGLENPEDEIVNANYNWMLLEMYDQTVRNQNGGDMGNYLYQDKIINEEFVMSRIGEGGSIVRDNFISNKDYFLRNPVPRFQKIKNHIKGIFLKNSENKFEKIGKFRLGGEIHQWMYDRYSLKILCEKLGGIDFTVQDASDSYLDNWKEYELDQKEQKIRKPDSLFIECKKA